MATITDTFLPSLPSTRKMTVQVEKILPAKTTHSYIYTSCCCNYAQVTLTHTTFEVIISTQTTIFPEP